jgi:cytochrome c biogenesis factor
MSIENLTKEELLEVVKSAVASAVESHPLSPEEIQWVRLAIKSEAERAAFRKAVIQKTLVSLVWAGVVGLGILIFNGFIDVVHRAK